MCSRTSRSALIILTILLVCSAVAQSASSIAVIPKPARLIQNQGTFSILPDTIILTSSPSIEKAIQLQQMLSTPTGFKFDIAKASSRARSKSVIQLRLDPSLQHLTDEGYTLTVKPNKITISSSANAGLFYGCQTLRQLLPAEIFNNKKTENVNWQIPCVTIEDKPLLKWRGMMLDCSRQFFDAEFVKGYIDNLAIHKINLFHWHLTDDDGWRIEIKGYPKLTELGAWRGDNEVLPPSRGSGAERYGGFYSQDQIREIVKYAADRHIDILPEIDIPGHGRALTASYPEALCAGVDASKSVQGVSQNVLCAGREENFKMLDTMISETAKLFPFEYIHIGGDEVNHGPWSKCPKCKALMEKEGLKNTGQIQNYFIKRMEKIVVSHGKKMIGWNEILHGGELERDTAIMSWIGKGPGIQAAKKGHPVIMTPGPYTYFDMAQARGEKGHWWAGIVTTEKVYSYDPLDIDLPADKIKNIFGVQGCLWSEFLDKPAGQAYFQTFPRLCALAEVAWTPAKDRNWDDFNNRLSQSHLQRLDNLGINYRVPKPAAFIKKGIVTIIPPFEGAKVRYTTDSTEPNKKSTLYNQPFAISDASGLRLKTFIGNRSSTATKGAQRQAAAKWTSKKVSEQFKAVDFDVTDNIDAPGNWHLDFVFKKGSHKLVIKQVELLQDGKTIASDIHQGQAGGAHKNNQYRLPIPNYSPTSKYV
ncbi:MAG: family 20 glycosylhydrolase, partial [Anaerohalosphaera sp.]|nr:family 20 glycosylhydrolase [Anaerohalosphaera sp.]